LFAIVNSSCYKNEVSTKPGQPHVKDAYGVSKHKAELALLEVAAATGLEIVSIRPPLVDGPGVKGKFLRLLGAIDHCYPLLFAGLDSRTSAVFLGNLVDLVRLCVETPAAAGEAFYVSDDEDLTSSALERKIGAAPGRPARMLPVPVGALSLLAKIAGKTSEIERLVGARQVDLTDARRFFSGSPPHTVEQGLSETAMWFRGRP